MNSYWHVAYEPHLWMTVLFLLILLNKCFVAKYIVSSGRKFVGQLFIVCFPLPRHQHNHLFRCIPVFLSCVKLAGRVLVECVSSWVGQGLGNGSDCTGRMSRGWRTTILFKQVSSYFTTWRDATYSVSCPVKAVVRYLKDMWSSARCVLCAKIQVNVRQTQHLY